MSVSRRTFIGSAGALGASGLVFLSSCGGGSAASGSASAVSGSQASTPTSTSTSTSSATASQSAITIGTLATEDLLPLWVAQDEGLFEPAGLSVDIVQFQSATELIAGVASAEVDLAMTDIMVAASMFASGIDIQMEWVTLGTTADQGRFGIMVGPDSDIQTLDELAGTPIGVGSNTILEYVMDCLMRDAGVSDDQIVVEELQKLPVRYQAMASGEVAAAALPGSLLALGEASGCRTIADDTKGENLSQSVMISRSSLYDDNGFSKTLEALEDVWDDAAALINSDPEAYRSVLVANANLSDVVADTYPISEYPACELPTEKMVDPVLKWMEGKGYLTKSVTYDEKTGLFS